VNDWTASVVTLTLVTKASSQFYQTCCPEKTRRDEQRPADSVIWISVSIPILTHWFSWAIGRDHRHIGCFGTVHKRRRRNSGLRFSQQADFSRTKSSQSSTLPGDYQHLVRLCLVLSAFSSEVQKPLSARPLCRYSGQPWDTVRPRSRRAVAVTGLPSTIHNSHASSSWVHDESTSSVIASRFNLKQKLHCSRMTHS
jgi:hypothetical protein